MNELGTDWRCTRVESSPSSLFFFSGPGPETRNTFTWVALKRNKNENTNQRFLDESERDYQVWNRCWEFQSRTQHGRPRKRERGGGRERDVIHFANRSRLCFFVNWFVKVPSGNRLFLLWDDVVVLFSSFFLFWASLCLSLVTGSDETFHSAHTPNWASRGTTKTKQWDEKQTKARPWNALIC